MSSGYTKEFLKAVPPINFSLSNTSKSEVQFKYYNSDKKNSGVIMNYKTVSSANIDTSLPTKFLIHGWAKYNRYPWYDSYQTAFFKKEKCNVITLDWSKASGKAFLVSSANVKMVGEIVADFIIASKIPPENIHFYAHSLGAHVAGFAGKFISKKTKSKLNRITAFDPACPTIEHPAVGEAFRLSKNDAHFVDVYHTDAGFFGFTKPIGHVDFYPNNGQDQPGCPLHKEDDMANHFRGIEYFLETMSSTDFKAKPCTIDIEPFSNGYNYTISIEKDGDLVVIGEHTPIKARGIYYFETRESSPFLVKS